MTLWTTDHSKLSDCRYYYLSSATYTMARMPSTSTSPSWRTVSRGLSALAILVVGVAATVLLVPDPLADVLFAGWVLSSVGIAVVGGIGAWTNRTPIVWLAAILLTGLSILGMWSIGLFIAPAALLLLGAAVFSHLSRPREEVRQTILAAPPSSQELASMTKAGTGALLVGLLLVGTGAFGRGLFGACARETASCVLSNTNWGGVGLTLLGLLAIGYGCVLIWKRVYVMLVLGSNTGA